MRRGYAQRICLLSDAIRLLPPLNNGHSRVPSLPRRHETRFMALHERRVPWNPKVVAALLPKRTIVIVCKLEVFQRRSRRCFFVKTATDIIEVFSMRPIRCIKSVLSDIPDETALEGSAASSAAAIRTR